MSSTVSIGSVPSFRDYRAARRQELRHALTQYWHRARDALSNHGLLAPGDVRAARAEFSIRPSRLFRQR
jgi:hypothetical protein